MEETKKKKNGFQSFLPDELIFNILLFLPADTLHQVMRHVCRQWYNIITDPIFVNKHGLQRSTTGLLVKSLHSPKLARFMETDKGVVTMKDLNLGVHSTLMDCCDGLILYHDCEYTLHVANPVTYERITLPQLPLQIDYCCGAIARCCSTRRFKVLQKYYVSKGVCQCKIITVGVDKEWRPTHHALKNTYGRLLGIGSVFYQVSNALPYIVTLDLEDETVRKIRLPKHFKLKRCKYAAMGNFLSMTTNDCDKPQWDVWGFTDCKKGLWTKLYKINLEAHRSMFSTKIAFNKNKTVILAAIAWVDNENVVIFSIPESKEDSRAYITHNIKTGKITKSTKSIKIDYFWRPHVNSLVSLKDH